MDHSKLARRALRYFFYARKSSEGDERQVQSIADQIEWRDRMTAQHGLHIVDSLMEQKSAKQPGSRPGFTELVERVQRGEAQGILSWKFDRLSRNPVDSGTLQWLLQQDVLLSILTSDREYRPEDNALLLSIDAGMSNQYIRDLRANTWRGMEKKIRDGWYPSLVPSGYLNDKHTEQGHRKVYADPERWAYVRRMWDLMLTGSYNPNEVLRIVNAEGFRTRKTKKVGGTPLTYSGIHNILTNVFYTGMFEFRGQSYQGAHPAMVTMTEFQRVQQLLGARGRPRPQSHEFAYTGLIRCGECGCMVTAETKIKYIKGTGETRSYT